ncbi:MAG: hypothetical protein MJ092_07710 [Lachnospiraceae bacterium]|nr:hypothetical protein [Lachnospiraceae bacterium]
MTPENKAKYEAKEKRVRDAIALREPDQIPIKPSPAIFPVLDAGYTVAESIYDETLAKYKDAIWKYHHTFEPDAGIGVGNNFAGQGIIMEMSGTKNMCWAGMPGAKIDDNSIQQHIEYPILLDDEFEQFWSDRTGWSLTKALPRVSTLFDDFTGMNLQYSMGGTRSAVASFSKPEVREAMKKIWALQDKYMEFDKKAAAFAQEVEEDGYPIFTGGGAGVPFDAYSDGLRGTINSLADIYERPEDVERYIEEAQEQTLAMIRAGKGKGDGKFIFMALHKGMDGFMGDDTYEKYYWRHLQEIIETIIEVGKVPYIFTEGKYNTRLKFLKDVPKGKVYYHFETVDMAEAKKELGDVACIAGGLSVKIMNFGTPQEVADETKRLIDICAPGGGFIFEPSCGLDYCSHANVEAMFDTVRTYGKH